MVNAKKEEIKKTVKKAVKKAKVETKKAAEEVKKTVRETFEVSGENLIKKVKELIKEGNVRKVIIKGKDGKELVQFPLTLGVAGIVLAPVLAAVGAIAALVKECSITVEKEG